MAKKKEHTVSLNPGGKAKARALVDLNQHGVKCGEFFVGSEILVAGLVASGQADDLASESDVYGDYTPPHVDVEE